MEPLKKVVEASYLTAEKAWSYRLILRYFYIQHERMREFLFPEEIFEYVKHQPAFANYTMEQLHVDLDQLTKWNNLVAHQETGKARTIEEFKKKRFRYQSTPYTIEFERMIERMEQSNEHFGGSLEKKEFERLADTLYRLEDIVVGGTYPAADECAQLWRDLFTYHQSIVKNTSDYFAYISSEQVEEQMQTEAFLVFKDQFTTYLRDFIREAQYLSLKIIDVIQSITNERFTPYLKIIVEHQQRGRFEDVKQQVDGLIEIELEKWNGLRAWFLGSTHGASELEMLEVRTNEQIRRISRVVQRLGERHHHHRSRKNDYLQLAKWFDVIEDVAEAHQLSAVTFGMTHSRHIFSDDIPSDDMYSSVWDEPPVMYVTKPITNIYREKTRPSAMVDHTEKQAKMMQMYLEQQQYEKNLLEQYVVDNQINLKDLPIIEPVIRKLLLKWTGKAMLRKNRVFETEYGDEVQMIIDPNERIILRSEDGNMEMPHIVFRFVNGVTK